MKKKLQVHTTKELLVDIPDEFLTKEALEDFSKGMWLVESPEKLFEYVAACCADGYEFIDGVGTCRSVFNGRDADIRYRVDEDITEVEILEGQE